MHPRRSASASRQCPSSSCTGWSAALSEERDVIAHRLALGARLVVLGAAAGPSRTGSRSIESRGASLRQTAGNCCPQPQHLAARDMDDRAGLDRGTSSGAIFELMLSGPWHNPSCHTLETLAADAPGLRSAAPVAQWLSPTPLPAAPRGVQPPDRIPRREPRSGEARLINAPGRCSPGSGPQEGRLSE